MSKLKRKIVLNDDLSIKKGNKHTNKQNIYRIKGQVSVYDLNKQDSFLKLLSYLDQAYHNQVKPYVTDDEYDRLVDLYELNFNTTYKKTGAPIILEKVDMKANARIKGNPKVKCQLPYVMPSLKKIKEQKHIDSWCSQPEMKALMKSKPEIQLLITNKIDGISGLLDYYPPHSSNKDNLRLTTRGNGRVGFDISHLLPYLTLPDPNHIRAYRNYKLSGARIVAIRMELVITKQDFKQIQLETNNKMNDARTTLAGIVNSTHDLNESLARLITCVAYEVFYLPGEINSAEKVYCTVEDEFDDLRGLNFNTPNVSILYVYLFSELNFDTLETYVVERKANCETEMDGIVLAVIYSRYKSTQKEELGTFRIVKQETRIICENEQMKQQALDMELLEEEKEIEDSEDIDVDKPWDKIAIKIAGERVSTKVLYVQWNASRHGVLFPTVYVEPVKCGHVTIDKATGKSGKFIQDNVIGFGAITELAHQGDTIPDITKIIQSALSGEADLPNKDQIPWKWNSSQVHIMVTDLNCPEVGKARLTGFFADLKAAYLGEATCHALYDHFEGNLNRILSCSVNDLMMLDGFQTKKATKTVATIQKVITNVPLMRLMMASSIFGLNLGSTRFQAILDDYEDVMSWKVTPENRSHYIECIQKLSNFNILAEQFVDRLPVFQEWIANLPMIKYIDRTKEKKEHNVILEERKVPLPTEVCFSGIRNQNWEILIKQYGGKINSTITKSTQVLVVKEKNSGSNKEEKAIKNNVVILTMSEFAKEYDLH